MLKNKDNLDFLTGRIHARQCAAGAGLHDLDLRGGTP
jgi:hypothetical protein